MFAVIRSLVTLPSTCVLSHVNRSWIWLVVLLAIVAALVPFTWCLQEAVMFENVAFTDPWTEIFPQEGPADAGPHENDPNCLSAVAETDFFGFGVVDIKACPKVLPIADFDKVDVDTEIEPGGGAVNMAEAYELATGKSSKLGVITGADAPGNLLIRLLGSRRANVRRIATAGRTRISVLTPRNDDGRETRTWTERSGLDEAATFAHIQTWLTGGRRLVLASMTAAQAGFVEQVLGTHAGQTVMMLTRSQCEDRERTLALAARCALVQLNAGELETLTGVTGDVVRGINCLREQGITSVIVTAGRRGIFAYLDCAGGWLHVPAFDVETAGSTSKCGDFVLGTFLAGLDRGESVHESLRIADAAAAMNAAGIQRAAGWQELVAFADQTPTVPFVRGVSSRTSRVVRQLTSTARRLSRPAGYMATGAAIVFVMIWIGGLMR